jgi:hypothetical protein
MIFIMVSSSYPDINGSVGILFEQASSRGHAKKALMESLLFHLRSETNSLLVINFASYIRDANRFAEYQRDFMKMLDLKVRVNLRAML